MKLNIRAAAAALLMAGSITGISAQNRSGYFSDGYLFNYQVNPAIGNTRGYFSIPGLGNFNVDVMGTIGVKNILYNVNGRTTTLLNPGVSVAEAMKGLRTNNRIGTELHIGILSFGFKGMGGYNTFAINARANVHARIPKALFSLVKEGVSNQTYDISNLGARAESYAEVAISHSHELSDKRWRIGAALKVLVGAGYVNAQLDKAELSLGTEAWQAVTNARINASITGLSYDTDYSDKTRRHYVSGANIEDPGIGGFGGAVDLGATFKLNNDWTFSAALTDLGAISWKNNMEASTNGDRSVVTSDYLFNVDGDSDNSFSNELNALRDGLLELYQLDNNGDQGSRLQMIGATMTLGAQYHLPVYRPLSFGLLSTTRFLGDYTWTEARLSANYNRKAFSFGINGVYGTYGLGFGWLISLNYPGLNFYLSSDQMVTKLAKQGVPLSSNASLSLGLNIAF